MQELEQYIEAHQDSFYRIAFTYVKDREAALDVVQNAVVQALTHAHTLRDPSCMRTWFYRILVNEGLGYLRKTSAASRWRSCPRISPARRGILPSAWMCTGR